MLCLLVVLYPLIYILSASFSSTNAIASGRVWLWPVEPSLRAYDAVFHSSRIWLGYRNSAFYATFGTLINIVMTVLAAYPLSRRDFYGRKVFMFIFLFTMLFSGGLVPTYLLVYKLGFINTIWSIVIPPAINVYLMIIARTFFQSTIPAELYDAAEIDGCSDLGLLYRVVVPLSKPVLAVLVLNYALNHWNTYFHALLYLTSERLFPLQIFLREIFVLNQVDPEMVSAGFSDAELQQFQDLKDLLKYAVMIVANIPLLLAYPFLQRYFVKGVMIGSLKG